MATGGVWRCTSPPQHPAWLGGGITQEMEESASSSWGQRCALGGGGGGAGLELSSFPELSEPLSCCPAGQGHVQTLGAARGVFPAILSALCAVFERTAVCVSEPRSQSRYLQVR